MRRIGLALFLSIFFVPAIPTASAKTNFDDASSTYRCSGGNCPRPVPRPASGSRSEGKGPSEESAAESKGSAKGHGKDPETATGKGRGKAGETVTSKGEGKTGVDEHGVPGGGDGKPGDPSREKGKPGAPPEDKPSEAKAGQKPGESAGISKGPELEERPRPEDEEIGFNPRSPEGNERGDRGGLGPPDAGGGGMGERTEPWDGKLRESSEENPAMQFMAFGKNYSGMCQLTLVNTGPVDQPPCLAMTAAHCLQTKVRATDEKGVFEANIQSPQLADKPMKVKVHVAPEYARYMDRPGSGNYHLNDAAFLEFDPKVCENAVKKKAQRVKLCSQFDEGSAYRAMSHRTGLQTVVKVDRGWRNVVPPGYSVGFRAPDHQGIIMQGDSGGPIVKITDGSSKRSRPEEWVCMMGPLSTGESSAPRGRSREANYTAGPKALEWLNAHVLALKKKKGGGDGKASPMLAEDGEERSDGTSLWNNSTHETVRR